MQKWESEYWREGKKEGDKFGGTIGGNGRAACAMYAGIEERRQ